MAMYVGIVCMSALVFAVSNQVAESKELTTCEQLLSSENVPEVNKLKYELCQLMEFVEIARGVVSSLHDGISNMLTQEGVSDDSSADVEALRQVGKRGTNNDNDFLHFGKRKHEYLRFGKRKHEYLRFG